MQAGETLSKALNRLGFFTLVYPEYPSRIRGGDNHIQIIFSSQEALSPQQKIDLLLALSPAHLQAHAAELAKNETGFESEKIGLKEIARSLANPLVENTAGLGFLWAVLGFELGVLKSQLKKDFASKKNILNLNLRAAQKGYEKGKSQKIDLKLRPLAGREIVNLTGNEALTQGILAAQCRFAAIYPMTPINAILTLLAKTKVTLFRPEDEIAGITAAIGASYAGKRALVATSGGGFSLMVEALGMAGITETPIVIVVGQRTGPSTGIATYSSQADLNFVIHAGHGEFPRIVLAPGDLEESSRLGTEAFNLAERYQVPVILLTDKYLAESRFAILEKDWQKIKVPLDRGKPYQGTGREDYERYQLTTDGVSPRAFPGQTVFLTNSYEHDEHGFSSDEPLIREKMMQKRAKKLESLTGGFEEYGEKEKKVVVGWGSTKGILRDFVRENPGWGLLHFWRLWPFPKGVKEVLAKAKKVVVVEGNFSGQLAGLIEAETGLKTKKILKDNGRPFFKEELEEKLNKIK